MNGTSAVPREPNVRCRGQPLGRAQNHSECCLKRADHRMDQTTLSSNIYLKPTKLVRSRFNRRRNKRHVFTAECLSALSLYRILLQRNVDLRRIRVICGISILDVGIQTSLKFVQNSTKIAEKSRFLLKFQQKYEKV